MRKEYITQIERMLCQLCIGILTSLLKKEISLREAQQLIFSPFTNEYLKDIPVSRDLINIIHRGCELEDINSLLPEIFDDKVDELLTDIYIILKEMPKINYQLPTWFSHLNVD